ncbi:MAG: hypothetical protein WC966_10270 [Bradymonadales bacterium]
MQRTERRSSFKAIFILISLAFTAGILSCDWDPELGTYTGQRCPPQGIEGTVISKEPDYQDTVKRCAVNLDCVEHESSTKENRAFECKVARECSSGQIHCMYEEGTTTKTKCVDPKTDLQFCGARADCTGDAAGQRCAEGQTCENGLCTCPRGHIVCEGTCIDPSKDNEFCGASGNCENEKRGTTCQGAQSCVGGACSCTSGNVFCGDDCIDPRTNKEYCGAKGACNSTDADSEDYRGTPCREAESCIDRSCRCPGSGVIYCDGICIDPDTSKTYCGAKGNCKGTIENEDNYKGQTCVGDEICLNGLCQCPGSGMISCNVDGTVKCIDPLSNDDFCGAQMGCVGAQKCTTDADGNISKCVNGKCLVLSCTNNKQLCPELDQNGIATGQNVCRDLFSDKNHCGACNFECNSSKYPNTKLAEPACAGGICQYDCNNAYENCGSVVEPLCLSHGDMTTNHQHCGQCNVNCLTGAGIDAGDCVGGNCYCEGGTCKKAAVTCDPGICQLTATLEKPCVDTVELCGNACKNCTENATNASCENGLCFAKECNKYYHPEKRDGHVVCVSNTPVSCAPPTIESVDSSPSNCTTLPNAKSSYCGEEGYCVITECNDGYHIVKGQNSDDSCAPNSGFACADTTSSQPVNCYESITNSVVTSCDKGKCIVKECAPGYHIGNDDKSCVANTKSACGLPDSNATVGCNDRCRLGICWRRRDKNNIYCGGGSGASIECWTDNIITRACIPKSDDMPPYACAYVCNDSGESEKQRLCDGKCLYLINGTDCEECAKCTSGQTCYKDEKGNVQCRNTLQP